MSGRQIGPREVQQLVLDTEPWLSCDDCFALIDEYVERLLDGTGTALEPMRAHLRGCPACAEEAATLVVLAAEESGQDPGPIVSLIGR